MDGPCSERTGTECPGSESQQGSASQWLGVARWRLEWQHRLGSHDVAGTGRLGEGQPGIAKARIGHAVSGSSGLDQERQQWQRTAETE